MPHRISRWLLAAAAIAVSSSSSFAQDPIPVGYSPGAFAQPGYGYPMPYGYSPYAMPQQAPPPDVTQAGLRSHSIVAAPPVASVPSSGAPCATGNCGCSGFLCGLHSGRTVALCDGSHIKSCFANLFGGLGSHGPLIARRPGPVGFDTLPTHPYARSPRDFFMFYENLEAERSRDLRPAIIP